MLKNNANSAVHLQIVTITLRIRLKYKQKVFPQAAITRSNNNRLNKKRCMLLKTNRIILLAFDIINSRYNYCILKASFEFFFADNKLLTW